MNIEFETAKNGEQTAKCNSLYLHSKYNPTQEAKRIVENISLPYAPKNIIAIEPALSYNAKFLREKFPNAKIHAVRISSQFKEYDAFFDSVFYYSENDAEFSEMLFNCFGEEKLMTAYFLQWENSAKVFKNEITSLWQSIKDALEKAKTLLITRQYFEKKWLLNSVSFFKYAENFYELKNTSEKNIAVIASGPSLKSQIQVIKKNQKNLFIIALSSAVSACLYNGIKIDLCVSTDGGFWAGEHLKKLKNSDIPVALSPESFCKKSFLKNLKIVPLNYKDGISKKLMRAANLNFLTAERNGTVSGTAVILAEKLTEKKIFCFGLDLSSAKGFQHTMPNELESNSEIYESRINNRMTRLSKSQMNGASLKIYENWFCNANFPKNKIFRVIEKSERKNSLGKITDIDKNEFDSMIAKTDFQNQNKNENPFFLEKKQKADINAVWKVLQNEDFERQIFPLDFVTMERNPSEEKMKKIQEEKNSLIKKLKGILYE